MSIFHLSHSESTETELHHCSVVDDLSSDISVVNRLLQVAHEHQIASLEPFVVKGKVVDIVKDCLRSDSLRLIVGVDVLAELFNKLLASFSALL